MYTNPKDIKFRTLNLGIITLFLLGSGDCDDTKIINVKIKGAEQRQVNGS